MSKAERAIVERMNRRSLKKTFERAEPEFEQDVTKVTVDKALPKPDSREDVEMLRELKD